MIDPNDAAFARPRSNHAQAADNYAYEQSGLSIRQYFAASAMQGLLASGKSAISREAIAAADALIAELNK